MALRSVNPATGEELESHAELGPAELGEALERAERAFDHWRNTPFTERSARLREAAAVLRKGQAEHARRMVLEMGKPIGQAEAEVEKCAWACEFYAEHAERFLAPETVATDAERSYVRYDPLGPVLAVMPWNFPYWQVFRFAAPTLMAGNVGLLKHASNVTGCSLAIEEVFRTAGCPEGVFQSLRIGSGSVANVIDHEAVRAVTLTGSEAAGMRVAEKAGSALKKTVLELGGSDPFVVLDDVEIEAVARAATQARTVNTGQSCIAAKRFIVHEAVADAFVAAFRAGLEALVVGDPLDPETDLGPLARPDLVDDLDALVQESIEQGAQRITGGRRLPGPGCFYAPTLLDRVTPGMAVAARETFGPAAAVLRVASDEEAVAVANQSAFGLGASVWSGDAARAERLAPRIEAGHVAINGIVKSDPRLPFGGVKQSGYGRELGAFGIREFVNVKTVWVGPAH